MTVREGIALGLSNMLNPTIPIVLVLGSLIGTLVGALPGLGSLTGCALLLPIAYSMSTPQEGMCLLVSIYLGNMFGGRITAILINIPGDDAAVVTSFDGYPMMQKGEGGVALGISAFSSFFGGFVSFILLAGFAPALARLAFSFGPAEYAAVILFACAAVTGLAEKQLLRSSTMLLLGILLSFAGTDSMTMTRRYAFGPELFDGLQFAVISLGVFGVSEALSFSEQIPKIVIMSGRRKDLTPRSFFPTWRQVKECIPCMLRATFIGSFVGFLPGAGAAIATFISYSVETYFSKEPARFGTGVIQGVAAPEAANNASVGGSMIPMLALGIPGSPTAAILMGAMMMFGLRPGPLVFEASAPVVWTIIVGLFFANIILLAANILLLPQLVRLVDKGQMHLKPIICAAVTIGVFAVTRSEANMYICALFGALGYLFKKLEYPLGPFLLALVLFPDLEVSFRRALMISGGNYAVFFTSPISATCILLSVLSFVYPVARWRLSAGQVPPDGPGGEAATR